MTNQAPLQRVNDELTREIAERVRAEAEAQASAQQLQTVIDTVGEGITLSDETGYFQVFNSRMERITGYTKQEANNCDDFLALLYPDPAEYQKATAGIHEIARTGGYRDVETTIRARDGTRKTLRVSSSIVQHRGREWFLSAYHDITERVQVEEQVRAALREKESILAEIHHRVKNNLQIVSSLLDFQARYTRDEHVTAVLRDSQHRVRSIALIHEQLYRAPDLARIDFATYAQTLISDLGATYGVDQGHVTLKLDVRDVFLEVKQAIPCGLIINELVSNALKHAFPFPPAPLQGPSSAPAGGKEGGNEICVAFYTTAEREYVLTVSDNGVGLPPDFEFPSADRLGMFLIETFVRQLKGTVEFQGDGGMTCRVVFGVSDEIES